MVKKKYLVIFLLVTLWMGLFYLPQGQCAEGKKLRIYFLPVQEGEATLVKTPLGKSILIDGGGIGDGQKLTENLLNLGVKELDLVIATHPHGQNIGGLIQMMQNIQVKEIIDSGFPYNSLISSQYLQVIEDKKIPLSFARMNQLVNLDSGVQFKILAPPNYPQDEADAASVVCLLTYGKHSFLFTGDSPGDYWKKIKAPLTVLKVAKRGQASSLNKAFLEKVKPQAAIIFKQNSAKNGPSPETLQFLENNRVKTYLVGGQEGINVYSDGKKYEIISTRQEKSIVISLSQHTLSLYWNGEVYKQYQVAVGKPSTPSPRGKFKIVNKSVNPGGPFGVRWMGFHPSPWPSYGIHGTNMPNSIGKSASHGCIRMYNQDVVELYSLVKVGTPVTIIP